MLLFLMFKCVLLFFVKEEYSRIQNIKADLTHERRAVAPGLHKLHPNLSQLAMLINLWVQNTFNV